MKYLKIYNALALVFIMSLISSCGYVGEDEKSETGNPPYINLEITKSGVDIQEVEVGIDDPVTLTATVTKDAAGRDCRFSSNDGEFGKAGSGLKEQTVQVDANGAASVVWIAPDKPGVVQFSVAILGKDNGNDIEIVTTDSELKVTPVPQQIELIGLPDSLTTEDKVWFEVRVPQIWAGKPVSISAPYSILHSSPEKPDEADKRTDMSRISVLTDSSGVAKVLLTAPNSPQEVTVIVDLFGTVYRQEVQVNAKESTIKAISLELSQQEIGVGIRNPVIVTAKIDKGASGKSVTFTASKSDFKDKKSDIIVDSNDEASIFWYAPEDPGIVDIYAEIDNLRAKSQVNVIPVPDEIEFENLPETLKPGQEVLFRVRIPADWARHAVEITAPQAEKLVATGNVDENLGSGPRILPISDNAGNVDVLLFAPNEPKTLVITATLFGTVKRVLVEVKD